MRYRLLKHEWNMLWLTLCCAVKIVLRWHSISIVIAVMIGVRSAFSQQQLRFWSIVCNKELHAARYWQAYAHSFALLIPVLFGFLLPSFCYRSPNRISWSRIFMFSPQGVQITLKCDNKWLVSFPTISENFVKIHPKLFEKSCSIQINKRRRTSLRNCLMKTKK